MFLGQIGSRNSLDTNRNLYTIHVGRPSPDVFQIEMLPPPSPRSPPKMYTASTGNVSLKKRVSNHYGTILSMAAGPNDLAGLRRFGTIQALRNPMLALNQFPFFFMLKI